MPVLRAFAACLIGVAVLSANETMAQGIKAASLADCNKITNDDAFNKCLASFGPRKGQRADPNDKNIPDADDPPPGKPAREVPPEGGAPNPAAKSTEGAGASQGARQAAGRGAARSRGGSKASRTAAVLGQHGIIVTPLSGGRYRFHIPMQRRRR
jgi:hypothetical protein